MTPYYTSYVIAHRKLATPSMHKMYHDQKKKGHRISYLVLTTDIPNSEANVLVLNSFNVKSYGGDGGDDLAELELVEDGGLTSRVETNHEDPHLLLGKEAAEQFREREPHLRSCARSRGVALVIR